MTLAELDARGELAPLALLVALLAAGELDAEDEELDAHEHLDAAEDDAAGLERRRDDERKAERDTERDARRHATRFRGNLRHDHARGTVRAGALPHVIADDELRDPRHGSVGG